MYMYIQTQTEIILMITYLSSMQIQLKQHKCTQKGIELKFLISGEYMYVNLRLSFLSLLIIFIMSLAAYI